MGKSAKNKQSALSDKMFDATEKQLEKYNEEQIVQRGLLICVLLIFKLNKDNNKELIY